MKHKAPLKKKKKKHSELGIAGETDNIVSTVIPVIAIVEKQTSATVTKADWTRVRTSEIAELSRGNTSLPLAVLTSLTTSLDSLVDAAVKEKEDSQSARNKAEPSVPKKDLPDKAEKNQNQSEKDKSGSKEKEFKSDTALTLNRTG